MASAEGVNRGWSAAGAPLPWPSVSRSSPVPRNIALRPHPVSNRLTEALAATDAPALVVGWRRDPALGAARSLARDILSPLGWPDDLTHDAAGAPVSAWLTTRGLSVSLSVSGGLAACAVLRGGRVGVDVEKVDPSVDMVAVADHRFDPVAARRVAEAAPADRPDRFFRLWTLLEASLKALGVGFSRPTVGLTLSLEPLAIRGAEPAGLVWRAFSAPCEADWRLSLAVLTTPDFEPVVVMEDFSGR